MKLKRYGIHPKLVDWIESFLKDRTQTVVINGVHSFVAPIISGVPQGTVLGPILFIIFINDIGQCVKHSTIRCFADDRLGGWRTNSIRSTKFSNSSNSFHLLLNSHFQIRVVAGPL